MNFSSDKDIFNLLRRKEATNESPLGRETVSFIFLKGKGLGNNVRYKKSFSRPRLTEAFCFLLLTYSLDGSSLVSSKEKRIGFFLCWGD